MNGLPCIVSNAGGAGLLGHVSYDVVHVVVDAEQLSLCAHCAFGDPDRSPVVGDRSDKGIEDIPSLLHLLVTLHHQVIGAQGSQIRG
jgi:hypothetical protein